MEILELLGYGAMGAVYKARQPQLDRMVAIKILSKELAEKPAFVERFDREAKMLARMSHPNIVSIYDFGTAGPYCYLLMEHVDGVNLRQAMEAGGFKPAEALALVQDVCAALQYAHAEGILHRDIKPENVLIDSKGRVKIADFGIAKMMGVSSPTDVTLTMQGSIIGTPHYMAPEQIESPGEVDQRADIYSLGVVLYEMLTGELPLGRFALPSEKAEMDARIDEIVLRTLAKEREARYQSAGEVGTQVAHVAANPQAPGVAQPPQSPAESKWARFSIASPVLTGVSIVMFFTLFLLWIMALNPSNYMHSTDPVQALAQSLSEKLASAIRLAWSGLIAAMAGFIMGIVALVDVRKSLGRKSGAGFAVFAVVAWPLILALMVHSILMVMMPGGAPVSYSNTPYLLIYLAPALIGASVFIRGLYHWVAGVKTERGERRFPGMGLSIAVAAGLFMFGPLAQAVIAIAVGSKESPAFAGDGTTPGTKREWQSSIFSHTQVIEGRGDVQWHHGEPDQRWSFDIAEDLLIEKVQLVPKSEDGWTVRGELDNLFVDPSTDPPSQLRFEIEFGASLVWLPKKEDRDEIRDEFGFAVRNVNSAQILALGGFNHPEKWTFEDLHESRRLVKRAGVHEIPFASHPYYPSINLVMTVREK